MSWYDYIPNPIVQLGNALSGGTPFGIDPKGLGDKLSNTLGVGSGDPSNPYRAGVLKNAQNAAGFAGQGQAGYVANQAGINQSIDALRAQANGQNSVSAEQLRQGLMQNQAAQQSMAAGASPQNSAMAARNAAMNMGRMGYGLAGQQAVAGLQERQQAQQALGQLQLGQSGQNLQGALGGYGAANQGYGVALGTPEKTWGSMIMGGLQGGAQIAGAMSDRRLKKDIKDGEEDAGKAMEGLRAYVFRYKGQKYGKGKQLGIMAQDLEAAGLGHAVIDTPEGKAVDGAKLATSIAAMLPGLHRRLSKLESDEK